MIVAVIVALIAVSCAVNKRIVETPIMPPTVAVKMSSIVIKPHVARTNDLVLYCPGRGKALWWDIQTCTNLANPKWTLLVSNVFYDVSNSSAGGWFQVTNLGGEHYYRLMGHTNWN